MARNKPGHRGGRATKADRKGKARKAKRTVEAVRRKTVSHPQVGDVPMIWAKPDWYTGSCSGWWMIDPEFRPRIPPGAIRARFVDQWCASPERVRFWYEDRTIEACRQCGAAFAFTAREQQFWYESMQFSPYAVPVRCLACRRQRRSLNALRVTATEAHRALSAAPSDPELLLAFCEARIRLYVATAEGKLEHVVTAARKAARRAPQLADEAALWEGWAQALAGRPHRAAPLLEGLDARLGGRRRRAADLAGAREALAHAQAAAASEG